MAAHFLSGSCWAQDATTTAAPKPDPFLSSFIASGVTACLAKQTAPPGNSETGLAACMCSIGAIAFSSKADDLTTGLIDHDKANSISVTCSDAALKYSQSKNIPP